MFSNSAPSTYPPGGFRMIFYLDGNTCSTSYSWGIQLNNGKWLCVGNNGKSESMNYYDEIGCYMNP